MHWQDFDLAMKWLQRALKDVGHGVGGWGWGFNADGRPWCMSVSPWDASKEQVEELRGIVQNLWDNEKPGFTLDFRVTA